jgi:hypothetical protein
VPSPASPSRSPGPEDPVSRPLPPRPTGIRAGDCLHHYFRSGWAFLISYLVPYLLYAWLRWPVNPPAGQDFPSFSLGPPCLLHLYWGLHAVHGLLGAVALRFHWRRPGHSSLAPRERWLDTFYRGLPWVCLALVFWIPGIYLEWPADPWEHLRRINEWHGLDWVTAHSSWKKASYFLPYSLTGPIGNFDQLGGLTLYYTAVCLLLSWQYYRLARAVGLSEPTSFIVVILIALTLGNSVFSFHRYYGLSSTVFAQIGAVAFTRVALDALRGSAGAGALAGLWRATPSLLALLLLTAFNHPQGLGIAGFGLLAVVAWRLVERKRQMAAWLAVGVAIASAATVLWFPRNPVLDEVYRPQGWLTPWYGFNFFSTGSPAFERSLQILGAFGVTNLAVGLWLVIRRNHVAGWLTLMPVAALACPLFAIPFAHVLSTSGLGHEGIVTFHRVLFLAPGLALVAWAATFSPLGAEGAAGRRGNWCAPNLRDALVCLGLAGVMVLAPGGRTFNRFWQAVQVPPHDLQLRPVVGAGLPVGHHATEDTLAISSTPALKMQRAFASAAYQSEFREIQKPSDLATLERQMEWLAHLRADSSWRPVLGPGHSGPQNDYVVMVRSRATASRPREMDLGPETVPWVDLARPPGESNPARGHAPLGNDPGQVGEFFAADFIPVARDRRYRTFSVIHQTGASTGNYLAVAWYDGQQRLLASNVPAPVGAGYPPGWANGTYSYYGLVGQPAPSRPARYSISFGLGEQAAIPAEARYLRIGVLLNYQSVPGVRVELSAAGLAEIPPHARVGMHVPRPQSLTSPTSFTGLLSRHWSPQFVPVTFTGSRELREAVDRLAVP